MTDRSELPSMTFEEFRRSFHYGSRTDLRFKFLASRPDDDAADAVARILRTIGQACDTGARRMRVARGGGYERTKR